MAEEGLKEYLRVQARSLDSLLELTPAKNMFGGDVSDQWQKKKQTPEQKKAARLAKLDPANWKSAKDIYDERSAEAAKKRKREQSGDEDGPVQPAEQQAANETQVFKKRKTDQTTTAQKQKPTGKIADLDDAAMPENKNLIKKHKKRAARKQRRDEALEMEEEKQGKTAVPKEPSNTAQAHSLPKAERANSAKTQKPPKSKPESSKNKIEERKGDLEAATSKVREIEDVDIDEDVENKEKDADAWSAVNTDDAASSRHQGKLQPGTSDTEEIENSDEEMDDTASTASSSEGMPEVMSPRLDSTASSVSSTQATLKPVPTQAAESTMGGAQPPQKADGETTIQTEADRQAARQRLQQHISYLRSQRKADDKPVRSRAELLAQRRQKEQERKAAKKEQRSKEKEEEAKRQDEEMARRFSPGGSGSLLASPRSPMIDEGDNNAFTFGRIAFEDGTQLDPSAMSSSTKKRQKGPMDPATALKAAQAKQVRISGLDDAKKQDIDEKDMWLNARKRAHGEKVKDDTSLLKKALKRHEKQKQRSEKDWDKRVEGVRSSQEARQKKRTDNLQKRKDEKGGKKPAKKVKRPGFEGSFRGRTGKSNKK